MSICERVCDWRWWFTFDKGDDDGVAPVAEEPSLPPKKRARSKPTPKPKTKKPAPKPKTKKPTIEQDIIVGRYPDIAPVNISDRGLERVTRAPNAVISIVDDQLNIVVSERGKQVAHYQCDVISESSAASRLQDHRYRMTDIATWAPVLFWNAHYYKLVPRV